MASYDLRMGHNFREIFSIKDFMAMVGLLTPPKEKLHVSGIKVSLQGEVRFSIPVGMYIMEKFKT